MQHAQQAIELLVSVAEDYAPRAVSDSVAYLEKLRLYVELREAQAVDAGIMALFLGEVNASPRQGQPGINITCVGMESSMDAALGSALGQWAIGVLPVLAQWRGEHSCFAGAEPVESRGGQFTVLTGPTIMRGAPEGDAAARQPPDRFFEVVWPELRQRRLAPRVHWLELFASKSNEGSVDATCRWNNRDWIAGQKLLTGAAAAWSLDDEPMRTCRQFAMLVPHRGPADDITLPTFWERLRGRA